MNVNMLFSKFYVDFIKTEFGSIKFNFMIFNRLISKINMLISLNQILFFVFYELMMF